MTAEPDAPAAEPEGDATIRLRDLHLCFEGAVPAVIATASADGVPNVTYLSCVRLVDDDHVAASNQFFSKTSRNVVANPRASVLLIDPTSYDQFRLALAYERTERRGPVFERLREDVEHVAALEGMQDVFRLRAADIYRVLDIEQVPAALHRPGAAGGSPPDGAGPDEAPTGAAPAAPAATGPLAELSARLSRCPDLDTLVSVTVAGLAELFGYRHCLLALLDEDGRRLYTIASHGYDTQGVGSEVAVGEGPIGMAAARCTPIRLGNLRQMARYSRRVRHQYEDRGDIGPGREIPLPGLAAPDSCVAVPALALGQLVGVLLVESERPVAFTVEDEARLGVIAALVAAAVEVETSREGDDRPAGPRPVGASAPHESRAASAPATHVRHFAVDGSTFLDGEYLIKGVAGRILWSVLEHHDRDGRVDFTNRELRLDPRLELPQFRDNLDSRLILLKRRLDEREAAVRLEKTGRGRFRLHVGGPLRLDAIPATAD